MPKYIEIGKEDKKGVVAELSPFTDRNTGEHMVSSNGNYKHFVKMDNGDRGTCYTKDKEGSKWAKGTEVEYTIATSHEESDPSSTSAFLSLKRKDFPLKGGSGYGRGAKDYKSEAVMIAASNAANTIAVKDTLSEKDFPAYFKAFLNPMLKEIDDIYAI